MHYIYDDGGRQAAGFKGHTGDCVVRAIAIATDNRENYRAIYNILYRWQREYYAAKPRHWDPSPRNGVSPKVSARYLRMLGWEWTPLLFRNRKEKTHFSVENLPKGRLIVSIARHWVAVVDNVILDTYDSSYRRRNIKGYWSRRK
jgi:hypothetical protein